MKLFVIYDAKAEAYSSPFPSMNELTAQRELPQNARGTMYEQAPEDYTLFEVANYDEITGTITPYDAHRNVCRLIKLFGNPPQSDEQLPDAME